jgi:hypothetical protein
MLTLNTITVRGNTMKVAQLTSGKAIITRPPGGVFMPFGEEDTILWPPARQTNMPFPPGK